MEAKGSTATDHALDLAQQVVAVSGGDAGNSWVVGAVAGADDAEASLRQGVGEDR